MSVDKPLVSNLVGSNAECSRLGLDERQSATLSASAISLDPATSSDQEFFYRTFASTRAAEVALTGWSAEQQESFLRSQFEAQRRGYLMQTPDAQYWVIRQDGTAVGRLIVDRTPNDIHLIDIGLIPEFRRQGIGSALMAAIMQEGQQEQKAVRLFVERFNSAMHWYERFGFKVIGSGEIYLEMLWNPPCEEAGEATLAGCPEAEYVNVSDS
jgi:ribosomal protein S18 acetylase RimI-like enzyme